MKQKHYFSTALLIAALFICGCQTDSANNSGSGGGEEQNSAVSGDQNTDGTNSGGSGDQDTDSTNSGGSGDQDTDSTNSGGSGDQNTDETDSGNSGDQNTDETDSGNSGGESTDPAQPETQTDEDTPASFKDCSVATAQFDAFKYWLYTPSNSADNMPLIVYLHGGSGKGDDLTLITAVDGFPKYLQTGQLGDVRAYVVIPQLPADINGWIKAAPSIAKLIDETALAYNIDKNNVALTGHSMGGSGTWNIAVAYPDRFARIAPLSGSINNTDNVINKLKNIPTRAFVGSADKIVNPQSSQEIIAALKAAGGDAEITVFDGADHFSVPALTYLDADIDLVGWLIGTN